MPSKDWLEQHTKVQAYLDSDLSAKLSAWMKEKNLNQLSAAVVTIIEHYLTDNPPAEISSAVLLERIEALEKDMAIIKASLVEAGAKALAPKIPATVIVAPTERVEFTYTEDEAKNGLTKGELCERIGLTIYQAERAAKEQEMSGNDYLFKVTGWKPSEGKRPRYYPAT